MKTSTIIITIINFIIGLIAGWLVSEYILGNAPISSFYWAIGLLALSLLLAYVNMKMIKKGVWCMLIIVVAQAHAQQLKPQPRSQKWVYNTPKIEARKVIGITIEKDGRDTVMELPLNFESGPYTPPTGRFIMQTGQWQPMKEGSYRDTTFNPNDTLRRDSTLGIALFVDTLFTLRSAICLRIRESKRHSYGKGWFYDDPATEIYLSLVDGVWVHDLDDRLFLIFVPRKQFQDGKKKGVNEK